MAAPTAGQRWADDLARWAIPQEILDQAPESPWFHDPATFAAEGLLPSDSVSAQRAREALGEAVGDGLGRGTVLDVGCGGGRSSLSLIPEATHITGVDANEHMLTNFAGAADHVAVAHTEILGRWPDVADRAPDVDVVVCHHVLYNVTDIAPFLEALTAKARRRVVVELTPVHPQSASNAAWKHFWDIDRPVRPVAHDIVDVIAELAIADATLETGPRPRMAPAASDPAREVAFLRRRLCLPASRDGDIAAYLAAHPQTRPSDVCTIWWDCH